MKTINNEAHITLKIKVPILFWIGIKIAQFGLWIIGKVSIKVKIIK